MYRKFSHELSPLNAKPFLRTIKDYRYTPNFVIWCPIFLILFEDRIFDSIIYQLLLKETYYVFICNFVIEFICSFVLFFNSKSLHFY